MLVYQTLFTPSFLFVYEYLSTIYYQVVSPVLFGLQLKISQLEQPEGGLVRPEQGWRDLPITPRVTNQWGRTG